MATKVKIPKLQRFWAGIELRPQAPEPPVYAPEVPDASLYDEQGQLQAAQSADERLAAREKRRSSP